MTSDVSETARGLRPNPITAPKLPQSWHSTLVHTFSYSAVLANIQKGPIPPVEINPDAPEEKYLEVLSIFKFSMIFLLLIGITAYYLMCVTAINPWSITPQMDSPMFMILLSGDSIFDTFFTVSALVDFYRINRLHGEKGSAFSVMDILKMYLRMFTRFAPTAYIVLFVGVYVIPHVYGVPGENQPGPLWYSFEEVMFYQCQDPKTMASKLLFYSNIYPSFQDNKYGCMQWSFIYEIDMQLFLLTPFMVILYRKIGIKPFTFLLTVAFFLGIYQNYQIAKQY